jgi:hypothetical protein
MTSRRPPVDVSDHAVLRWLERIEGVDIQAIRRRIQRSAEIAEDYGAPAVIVGAARLVIHNGVVVTVTKRTAVAYDKRGRS